KNSLSSMSTRQPGTNDIVLPSFKTPNSMLPAIDAGCPNSPGGVVCNTFMLHETGMAAGSHFVPSRDRSNVAPSSSKQQKISPEAAHFRSGVFNVSTEKPPAVAGALLGALCNHGLGGPVSLDVPEPNAAGLALARRLGMEPAF